MTEEQTNVAPDVANQDVSKTETNAEQESTSSASVPSARLREEAEKRREAEAREKEALAKIEELQSQFEREKQELAKEAQKKEAVAKFGEKVVNDEKVQEYMTKYPDMPFDEAIKLAGVEPKGNTSMFVGRNPANIVDEANSNVYYREDVKQLSKAEQKIIYAKAQAGEIQLRWKDL